ASNVGFGDEVDAAFIFDLEAARSILLEDRSRFTSGADSKFKHFRFSEVFAKFGFNLFSFRRGRFHSHQYNAQFAHRVARSRADRITLTETLIDDSCRE